MKVDDQIPLLESILDEWGEILGKDGAAYKNHVYRVLNYCHALQNDRKEEDREKFIIAGCFHDLGIWSNDTFNYLSPSIELAKTYLKLNLKEQWSQEIGVMIDQHHKITRYHDVRYPLVEIFRKADWVDVSKGKITHGLSKSIINEVNNAFPNLGFHKKLIQLTKSEFMKNPLKPLPMMKW